MRDENAKLRSAAREGKDKAVIGFHAGKVEAGEQLSSYLLNLKTMVEKDKGR